MARLFLSNKDVQRLSGKAATAAQRLINEVRKSCGKGRYQQITVQDFAKFTGLDPGLIMEQLI
ncbi:hypothetical protein [Pedobacter sp. GR22-6]|uniref:hypothetical protein n=1 Tax=Pedobacter sp. GR22-6 TaxID=3127957 RepID=UPI00307D1850